MVVHAATYALTQVLTKAILYRTAGVRVPVTVQVAGVVTEGVLHAVIDDGRLLKRFTDGTGSAGSTSSVTAG